MHRRLEQKSAVFVKSLAAGLTCRGWMAKMISGVATQSYGEISVKVSPVRRTHILDGDATGGGHGPGRGRSGKSEFPLNLTDDEIIAGIEAIAHDPASYPGVPSSHGRVVIRGVIQGVDTIVVVVPPPPGDIITAWPSGVPANP